MRRVEQGHLEAVRVGAGPARNLHKAWDAIGDGRLVFWPDQVASGAQLLRQRLSFRRIGGRMRLGRWDREPSQCYMKRRSMLRVLSDAAAMLLGSPTIAGQVTDCHGAVEPERQARSAWAG